MGAATAGRGVIDKLLLCGSIEDGKVVNLGRLPGASPSNKIRAGGPSELRARGRGIGVVEAAGFEADPERVPLCSPNP